MTDPVFNPHKPGPSCHPFAITPDDTTAQVPFRGLRCGTGGTLKLKNGKGDTITFTNVADGETIPCSGTHVLSTGTTCSAIVGYA